MRFVVPKDASVLEIGSRPRRSARRARAVARRRDRRQPADGRGGAARHPHLEFVCAPGETFVRDEQFDYVVLSDLVPYADDLLAIFQNAARMTHPRSRVIIHSYSQLWRPVIRLAERLRQKPRKPLRNWVAPGTCETSLDWRARGRLALKEDPVPEADPVRRPLPERSLANLWPFKYLCLTYWIVARPSTPARSERSRASR